MLVTACGSQNNPENQSPNEGQKTQASTPAQDSRASEAPVQTSNPEIFLLANQDDDDQDLYQDFVNQVLIGDNNEGFNLTSQGLVRAFNRNHRIKPAYPKKNIDVQRHQPSIAESRWGESRVIPGPIQPVRRSYLRINNGEISKINGIDRTFDGVLGGVSFEGRIIRPGQTSIPVPRESGETIYVGFRTKAGGSRGLREGQTLEGKFNAFKNSLGRQYHVEEINTGNFYLYSISKI